MFALAKPLIRIHQIERRLDDIGPADFRDFRGFRGFRFGTKAGFPAWLVEGCAPGFFVRGEGGGGAVLEDEESGAYEPQAAGGGDERGDAVLD